MVYSVTIAYWFVFLLRRNTLDDNIKEEKSVSKLKEKIKTWDENDGPAEYAHVKAIFLNFFAVLLYYKKICFIINKIGL